MRNKIKASTDMIDRFAAELHKPKWINKWAHKEAIKAGMEAALNPPQEPEIVVTEDMLVAGMTVWCAPFSGYAPGMQERVTLSNMYRAMRKLEPSTGVTGSAPKAREAQHIPLKYQRTCKGSHLVENERKGPEDRRSMRDAWTLDGCRLGNGRRSSDKVKNG